MIYDKHCLSIICLIHSYLKKLNKKIEHHRHLEVSEFIQETKHIKLETKMVDSIKFSIINITRDSHTQYIDIKNISRTDNSCCITKIINK